jgi:uncharacterized protein
MALEDWGLLAQTSFPEEVRRSNGRAGTSSSSAPRLVDVGFSFSGCAGLSCNPEGIMEAEVAPPYLREFARERLEGGYDVVRRRDGSPRVLGSGKWGTVVKLRGPLGVYKAAKLLKPDRLTLPKAVDRFQDEIARMQQVRHPNVIAIENQGFWSEPGTDLVLPYYVMEFVDGKSIVDWADRRVRLRKLPTAETASALIRQVVAALARVHDAGIFHLDLKPANILVTEDGTPKVGDFGLARAIGAEIQNSLTRKEEPSSPGGREYPAMHPAFRSLLFQGFTDDQLRASFDLYGLGYTLSRVWEVLAANFDDVRRYILDALILRLTVAETDPGAFPNRARMTPQELDVPEYGSASEVLEAVAKLENPQYHLSEIPELRMSPGFTPPIRIAGGIHVPTSDRLRRVIDTPAFQRLRWMHQLDLVHYSYPGATHTRFEHSLACYYYALRYVRRLLDYPYFVFHFSAGDIKRVLLAALLHDIGHFPTAHALHDSEYLKLDSHELQGERILRDEDSLLLSARGRRQLRTSIEAWGVTPESVASVAFAKLADPEGAEELLGMAADDLQLYEQADLARASRHERRTHNLLHSIVSGPLDADKVAYLQTDSVHSGNPVGRHFDAEQLLDALALAEDLDDIAITRKGVAAVESLLFARYRMYIDVYWHHTARGARKMVSRSIDHFIKAGKGAKGRERRRTEVARAVASHTDFDLLEHFLKTMPSRTEAGRVLRHLVVSEKVGAVGDTVTALRPRRELFRRVCTYIPRDPKDDRRGRIYRELQTRQNIPHDLLELERTLALVFGGRMEIQIAPWEIIIDVPNPKADEWPEIQVADVNGSAHSTSQELVKVSKAMEFLAADFARQATKIRLYVSPRIAGKVKVNSRKLNAWVEEAIALLRQGSLG